MIATQLASIRDVGVERVDISSTDALFQRYGLVIPVLQHPDGRELYWPFAAQQLDAFLRS